MNNPIAVILTNYNMPERANAMVDYLLRSTDAACDFRLFVVDNASDLVDRAIFTNVQLFENLQTVGGWNAGLDAAREERSDWLGYVFAITSAEFNPGYGDVLSAMKNLMLEKPDAVGVTPALTVDSTSAHNPMKDTGLGVPRETYLIDNIFTMWRADWFDGVGGFRKELTMGWGVDLETCWMARRDRRTIWVHEGVKVKKMTDIGYAMNRMRMSAEDRRRLASEECRQVLTEVYGKNYLERLAHEFCRYDHVKKTWVRQ